MAKIVLIACAAQKMGYACQAQDLYTSALFRKSLAYAKSLQPDGIYILSAKHRLVPLDRVLEPYELTLNTMGLGERKVWAHEVLRELSLEDEFIFLAGQRYREFLAPRMVSYSVPLEGMRIGEQLQWLTRNLKSA